MRSHLFALSLAFAGCGSAIDTDPKATEDPVPSTAVASQALGATIIVSDHGDGTSDAYVWLDTHGSNVEIVAPDALRASDGDAVTVLDPHFFEVEGRSEKRRSVSYGAMFSSTGKAVRVTLSRGEQSFESVVDFPTPFDLRIDSPRTVSRGSDDVVIHWTPSGSADRMYWYAVGDCIDLRRDADVADNGTLIIAKGTWSTDGKRADGSAKGGACDVSIFIRRSRHGAIASGLGGGGSIQADQLRLATFSTRP